MDNYKKEEKIEIKKKLDDLLIAKIADHSLIYKIINDWSLSKLNKDIIDTQLLKTNIVPYFIKNFPLLIMHKTNDLDIKSVKSDKKELLNETLKEIVNICKQLPLKDEELIKCLESSMILSGHYKSILPFLSPKTLFLFAALFKKNKIFIKLLIEQNISFIPNNLNKGLFIQDDNFFFIFNSFLSLNLCKYFNYRAKSQIDKNYRRSVEIYNKIIVERLEYLKEYPKLYSLLYKFESSFQLLDKLGDSSLKKSYVPFPISHYIGVFAKFLSLNDKEYTDKEFIDLIEIGNTISLYITFNGLTTTTISKSDIKSNSQNMYKIARFLIKLKELLLVYQNKNYKYLITVFSLFSALGITLIPEVKELKIFNIFPCAVLNNSSILIWSAEKYFNFLDILYKTSLFDSSTKNRLIFYNIIYGVFNEITHRAITKIFSNQNPFENMPVYNFLDPSKIKAYFDSLLYNYSLHRRKYLGNIASLNFNNSEDKEEKLINELNKIINTPKAYNTINNFGFYEDFCSTLCNWPGEDSNFETIDLIFSPFSRWGQRLKNDSILNFTQISIILGELPSPFETLLTLDNEEYKKSMNLIFDLNENLFNEIFYLYNKVGEFGTINTNKNKNFKQAHGLKEIERVFINYILFSLLINRYSGFKYNDFYNESIKRFTEELFNFIKYDKINFENDQQVFPYKIILHIFKNYNISITKLLKIIWIKKIYPFVLYSLKKSSIIINNEFLNLYGINEETIDFRYFNYYNIKMTNEEILIYLELLLDFIKEELFKNKAENLYNEELLKKSNKHFPKREEYKKYYYRGYLQNYIELQIYLIILSLEKIDLYKIKSSDFSNQIKEIIDAYYKKSFYAKKILNEIYYDEIEGKFMIYSFGEKNKLVENHIKIYKLSIREINVMSKYEHKRIPLKEVMNKNLLNRRYLFINNHKEQEIEIWKNDKYRNELINFLFVPLHKETLPQYLATAQKIYNDYWS